MAVSAAHLMVDIGADTSEFEKGITKSTGLMHNFSNMISRAVENSARLFIINSIMSTVSGAVEFATDSIIGFNARLEQASVAFEQFTGSAQMAQQILDELATIAANTPFEFESIVKTTRNFMALGLSMEQIRPLLGSISDGIATFGKGSAEIDRVTLAITQMITKGRVMAQEMNQLSEAGIAAPWKILADYMNKTTGEVQQMAEKGQVSVATFIKAFNDFAKNNWADAAVKQMHTFNGALTTIQDNMRITIADAFEPLFESMRDGVVAFAEFTKSDQFQTWAGNLSGTITVIGQAMGILVDIFNVSLTAILQIVVTIGQAIYEALSWLNPFATHSPSLVSQVEDGTNAISKSYRDMGNQVPLMMDKARAAVNAFKEAAGPGLAKAAAKADAEMRKQIGYLGGAAVDAYFVAKRAVAALSEEMANLETEINNQERALKAMEMALKPFQKGLEDARKELQRVEGELENAKAKLQEFMEAPLMGQAAFEDAMFAAEKAINQLQLAIINFKLGSGLDNARERVSRIRDELEEARDEYNRFSSAVLVGTKAYDDALFANELATKKLQLQLAELKPEVFEKIAEISKRFDAQILSNNERVRALSATIQQIKDDALRKINDRVDMLKDGIQKAHDEFNKFVNAQLVGTQQYDDALFANSQSIAKVRLAINELKMAQQNSEGNSVLEQLNHQMDEIQIRKKEIQAQIMDLTNAGATSENPALKALKKSMDDTELRALNTQIAIDKINAAGGSDNAALADLEKQLESLQLAGENIRLEQELDLGPQYRQLEQMAKKQEEITLQTAIDGAKRAAEQVDEFSNQLVGATQEQTMLNTQVAEMQRLIDEINKQTDSLELEKKLSVEAAMEPIRAIEAEIEKLNVEAEKIRLREYLDLEPQRRALDEIINGIEEMSFDQIVEGITRSRNRVEQLDGALQAAERTVRAKEKALQDMEKALERARLEAEKIQLERWMETAEVERNIAKIVQDFQEMTPEEKAAGVQHWADEVERLTLAHDEANKAVEIAQGLVDDQIAKIETQKELISGLKDQYDIVRDSVSGITDELKLAEQASKSLQSAAEAAAKAAKGAGGAGVPAAADLSGIQTMGAPEIDTTAIDEAKRVIEEWKQRLEDAKKAVEDFKKAVSDWKDTIIGAVDEVKKKVIPMTKAIGDGFKNVFGTDFEAAMKKGTKLIDETFDNIGFVFDSFIAGFKDTWDRGWKNVFSNTMFTDVLNMVTAVTETITRTWVEMFTFIYTYFNENIAQFAYIFERLGVLIAAVTTVAIAAITQLWKDHGEDIGRIFTGLFDILKAVTSIGLDIVIGLVAIAMGLLTGDFSGAVEAGKRMFTALWDHLKDAFNGIGKVISGFVGFFKDDIDKWLATGKAQFDNFYNFWVNGTTKFVEWMLNGFKNMWNNLVVEMVRWIGENITKFNEFDTMVKKALSDTFLAAWNAVVKWVTDTVQKFQDWVNETSKKNEAWKDSIIKNITDGIKGAWDATVKFVSDMLQKFTDWLNGGIEKFTAWKDNLIKFITEGAAKGLEALLGWIADTLGKLNAWATSVDTEVGAKWKAFIDGIMTAIKTLATDLWGAIYANSDSIYNKMKEAWGNISKAVMDYLTGPEGLVGKARNAFQSLIDGIMNGPLHDAADRLTAPFRNAYERIKDILDKMRDAWNNRPGQGGGETPPGGAPPAPPAPATNSINSFGENMLNRKPEIFAPTGAQQTMLPSTNYYNTYGGEGAQMMTVVVELDAAVIARKVAPIIVGEYRLRTGSKI